MENQKPDIFTYTDYRLYLKEFYNYLKSKDKKYSYRFIATQVKSSSPSWLSDIINKRINLTNTYISDLIKLLNLTLKQQSYFDYLVAYDQAASYSQKQIYFQKILEFKELSIEVIHKNQFDYFSNWYISAIRELLFYYNFSDNYDILAKKLNPPITSSQARKAIDILLSLDMVYKNSSGFYKPKDQLVKKQSSIKSHFWALCQNSFIDLASQSIDRIEKEKRDISSVTFHIDQESLQPIKEEIEQLRKKILSLSSKSKNSTSVYQCNIQLFPLTK